MRKYLRSISALIFIIAANSLHAQNRTEVFISPADTGAHYRIPAMAALSVCSKVNFPHFRFEKGTT